MLHSLFIETPLCLTKCSYCRYFRGLGTQGDIDEYFDTILPGFLRRPDIKEELFRRDYFDVYFGGGTPTLATPEQWRTIFDLLPLEK
jgi:oxygen-independent coproporphyrinogen-3 oxidase